MKKLISLMIIAAMLVTAALTLSVSADDVNLLMDLRPQADHPGDVQSVSGCEIEYEDDGTAVITLTEATATIELTFSSGGTILYGEEIDVGKTAYAIVDYASADGVTFDESVQAHYTRKDKAAENKVADLWLVSMFKSDYAQYVVDGTKGDGFVVWDWGTYVNSSDSKRFDDGMHRFTSMSFILHGTVGKKMYIYTYGIYDGIPEGLGSRRPEPTPDPVVTDESSAKIDFYEPVNSVTAGQAGVFYDLEDGHLIGGGTVI